MMRIASLIVWATITATPLAAQAPTTGANGAELLDRVVAVVGDTMLLQSDVLAAVNDDRNRGVQVPAPEDSTFEDYARQVLERRVSDLILVVAAREAGLTPFEDQVTLQVEQRIAQVQAQFGSEPAFRAALAQEGLTLDQFRTELAAQARDAQLVQLYLESQTQFRTRPVIDDSQIQQFFEAYRSTFGQRPATLSFRQVIVSPEPSAEARAAAIAEAEEVLRELETGADFEVLARRFSDDAGTREHGGDLGWFRTGSMIPEVERAAYSMSPGQRSGVIESDVGFHIVRLDRTRGAERQARHILIRPEITDPDIQRARVRADSVATAVRAGGPISELADLYNNAGDQTVVTRTIVDQMPAAYSAALSSANVNDVVGPIELTEANGTRWAVVRLTERTAAGEYTVDDLRDQIRQELQRQAIVEQLLIELRDQVYVHIVI
jgi:peptidyl-prolyl cis-trans isomerase SurA